MTADVMTSEMMEIPQTEEAGGEIEKHALQNTWCLWVNMTSQGKKNAKQDWSNNNTMVHELNTVEDFWCLYNNINGPSVLGNGDVSFFKKGITPAWEDPHCAKGGRWVVKLEKIRPEQMDETWLNLMLALIGEQTFEDGDNDIVCGAVLSNRAKGASKLALWLKTSSKDPVIRIGQQYIEIMKQTIASSDQVAFENFTKQAYEQKLNF